MPASFAFTTRRVETAPRPESGRTDYRDEKENHLVLRVSANGSRRFYYAGKVQGQSTRIPLGEFPAMSVNAARKATREHKAAIDRGEDPRVERRQTRQGATLKELFDHWIGHAKQHKRTWRDDQRQWDKYLARYKNRKLASITKADVAKWHSKIAKDHGPIMANRVRALLSAMFAKADDIGFDGPNPVAKVPRFRETSRERFLLPNEAKQFFSAVRQLEPLWRDYFLLLLFTGARRSNVASMRWADLDLERGCWHLPGEKTKNGLPVVVVLPPPAVEILAARKAEANGSPYVFPAPSKTGHIVDPRKAWDRVRKDSGLPDLRMHDLRRSLGSWQATAGASLTIIGASLGHRDHKATQVYSRLQLDPVRQSVNGAVAAMLKYDQHDE